ncbi:MAG: hypothetical protein K5787_12630 [Lentisphaeria bacterium]|nr:hypothetical protein [Lentisphaeria bacterium]
MKRTFVLTVLLLVFIAGRNLRAQEWRLRSGELDVLIRGNSGEILVTDGRNGKTWRQPSREATTVRREAIKPVAAGKWDELVQNGAKWRLDSNMTTKDGRKVDGDRDCSATAWIGWNPQSLMLQVDVMDETFIPSDLQQEKWWERDSVEFWVNNTQYAVRTVEGKSPLWIHANGVALTAEAETAVVSGGYRIRVVFPLEGQVGKDIRFAVGVNDADSEKGREGQLYYPRGWVHSQSDTFAQLVMVGEDGKLPDVEEQAVIHDFTLWEGAVGASWRETLPGQPERIVSCWIENDDELHFSEALVGGDAVNGAPMVKNAVARDGFVLSSPMASLVVADYSDGHIYSIGQEPFIIQSMQGHQLDIPFIGIIDGAKGRGYSLILDDPDDAVIKMNRVEVNGAVTHVPQLVWMPRAGGVFGGERREYRYHFINTGGYVKLAKRWREIFRQKGYLVSLLEKAKANPNVDKLIGAADIWGGNLEEFAKRAHAEGVSKLLINDAPNAAAMQAMNEMGYLTGRYDNYTDILPIKDGESADRNHGRIPEDCVLQPNGERMKAWLTFDKKKQYMKRCPSLWVETAKKTIPPDLKEKPYNARFIDVTTAEGLYECYDPEHPLDRTAKRLCGEELLKYVGRDLKLVAGGEHGRWWGVRDLHYLEGMMSGGAYSWPAGHLLRPKTKEENLWNPEKPYDPSDMNSGFNRYLKYGLGGDTRIPLWELVFHDCIVTTWYWGDSIDYLYTAAPETIAKKAAFNILYGTMPMFWIRRGELWDSDHEQFLQTYFQTAKMHETVGYHEMVSHEFITSDRLVQKTEFEDGTSVIVNFAPEVRTVEIGYNRIQLPENGFRVSSASLTNYRVVEGNRLVCVVETGDFRYMRSMPLDGKGVERVQQIWKTNNGTAMVRLKGDLTSVEARWISRSLMDGCVVYRLDEKGERAEMSKVEVSLADGSSRITFPKEGHYEILWGTAAQAPDLAVSVTNVSPMGIWTGRTLADCTVEVENYGMAAATGVKVAMYADIPVEQRLLATENIGKLAANEKKTVTLKVDPLRLGGEHNLYFVVSGDKPELMTANNSMRVKQDVALAFNRYPLRKTFTLDTGNSARVLEPVSIPMDLKELHLDGNLPLLAESVRLLQKRPDGNWEMMKYVQFDADEGYDGKNHLTGRLEFSFSAPANTQVEFMVVARQGKVADFAPLGMELTENLKNGELTYRGETYSVGFREGTIMDWTPGRRYGGGADFMGCLLVSSGETGWSREEQSKLERFEILRNGAAVTEIFVEKILKNGNRYQKLYFLYPGRLVVLVSLEREQGGLYSRGFYCREADYLDDKGNKAHLGDGKESAGIYGANKNPKWFALKGEGWSQTCVAVVDGMFENIAFWDTDGENLGQLGFYSRQFQGLQYTYFIHGKEADFRFAEDDFKQARTPVKLVK